jgi:membrane protein YqaA with SNARE-associated domain
VCGVLGGVVGYYLGLYLGLGLSRGRMGKSNTINIKKTASLLDHTHNSTL